MKKFLAAVMIFVLCFTITGCNTEKKEEKELTLKDVTKIMKNKYEVDTTKVKDSLYRIEIYFNNKKDTISYSVSSKFLSYDNSKLTDESLTIDSIDNEDFKYKKQEKSDRDIFDKFLKKLDEDLTRELFVEWVYSITDEIITEFDDTMNSDPSEIEDKITKAGYTIERDGKNNPIIKGDYKIMISNSEVFVSNLEYDLEVQTGDMYLPSLDTGSYYENGESVFLYSFEQEALIKGEATVGDANRLQDIKTWYENLLSECNVTYYELCILK
ncbi:MAG: hypothetical protein ACK5LC_06250 [Coprobacillaceae bacterium]